MARRSAKIAGLAAIEALEKAVDGDMIAALLKAYCLRVERYSVPGILGLERNPV